MSDNGFLSMCIFYIFRHDLSRVGTTVFKLLTDMVFFPVKTNETAS